MPPACSSRDADSTSERQLVSCDATPPNSRRVSFILVRPPTLPPPIQNTKIDEQTPIRNAGGACTVQFCPVQICLARDAAVRESSTRVRSDAPAPERRWLSCALPAHLRTVYPVSTCVAARAGRLTHGMRGQSATSCQMTSLDVATMHAAHMLSVLHVPYGRPAPRHDTRRERQSQR